MDQLVGKRTQLQSIYSIVPYPEDVAKWLKIKVRKPNAVIFVIKQAERR